LEEGLARVFSSAVKRVIPAPGTFGAFLSHVQSAGNYDEEKDALMEEAINARSAVKEDPWI
jgi:hypothetical protein